MSKAAEKPHLWSHASLERRSFRWWSHYGSKDLLSVEASWLSGSIGIGLQTLHDKWTASIRLGVASLYLSIPARHRGYGNDREIDVSFHDGSVWWRFWTDPLSWSSDTPRWRHGSFSFVDFLLGRSRAVHRVIESRDVLIPMPERAYPATAQLQEWIWKRPRWFAKTIQRVNIEIPGGIPFPGKGESAHNCGDDATYGLCTGPCRSIAEGVGILVGSVLRDRVRNGGYSDWEWKQRPAA